MAVTKGHGNPKWNREETILALELYFEFDGNPPSKSAPAVSELSEFLRQLPYHSAAQKNSTFRNVDGVHFKVQNLRSALTGVGLSNTSMMDRTISAEFGDRREEVSRLARLIRSTAGTLDLDDFDMSDDFEEEFYEGKSVFAVHRKVERNSSIRKKLLSNLTDHQLSCAICELSRPNLARALHESLFEIHHLTPLSELVGEQRTKLADVCLLCACCHRGIHKLMSLEKRPISIDDAKRLLA